jgi:putative membrane protein
MFLNDAESETVHTQIGRLEARTGVQVVTAVVGKADTYAELPWKAFALGAALSGFALVAVAAWRPQWVTASTVLVSVTTMLGVAATCALLAVFVPPFARVFLSPERRDLEVRQYAQSLFLAREVFRTDGRTGILILISLFERTTQILPDTGLQTRVTSEDWNAVVARMTSVLGHARPSRALEEGLTALEEVLLARGFQPGTGRNELPDRPIEERGA